MRIYLAVLPVLFAACDLTGTVTGGPPVASDQPVSQQQTVWLSLGGGQVRVLEARPAAVLEEAPPRVAGRVLRYELVSEAGLVVATGLVEDPREVMVEWSESGALQNAIASRVDPMVRIDLPAVEGELVLRDDTGVIGSASLTTLAPAPQRAALDAPVLVSGGGASATALDILFLPDGYTAGELAQFEADVVSHMNVLFQSPDWSAHRGSINIWRLDVPSSQSGIGESGVARDTAFGVARSTTITRLVYMTTAAGQAAADQAGRRIGAEKVVVIANTSGGGGSGGPIPVVGRTAPDALAHELGHSLLRLADEYEYFGGTGCDPSKPEINVAFSTSSSQIPWANLIAAGTPLPTPVSAPRGTIGAFQGADYCQTGAYRPQHDCLMRTLGQPMCAVCRAALDRYMVALTGGGGAGGDGAGGGGADPGGEDSSCTYTCHDYGYAPGQCYQGWQCEGTCLVNRGTCEGDTDPGAGTGESCEYACADYMYSPGQCHEGWECAADGCLHEVGSCPGQGGGASTDDCTYTCAEYGYAPGQCHQGWLCEASGECLVNVGVCPAGGDSGDSAGGTCQYTCAEYNYYPGECYDGWQCDAAGQCLTYTGGC